MVIDCLIIIKPWLEKILSGEKDMEIRGSCTHKRGVIGLIESGSRDIKGFATVSDCLELDKQTFDGSVERHQIWGDVWDKLPYKRKFGWILKNPVRLEKPIKYMHPRGAVVWVKVDLPVEVKNGRMYINGREIGERAER